MPRYLIEIMALIKLALPVALTQLAVVGMTATDVLIAGHAGTIELAGMNLGANTWNMIILFFMGIGFATQPLVAARFGASDDAGVKHQMHQSIWLGLASGILATFDWRHIYCNLPTLKLRCCELLVAIYMRLVSARYRWHSSRRCAVPWKA